MARQTVLLAALIGLGLMADAGRADVALSTSAAVAPPISTRLAALMGAERDALAALPPGALAAPAPQGRKSAKSAPPEMRHDAAWLATLPEATGGEDWVCLTRAIYFEARGETVAGRFAVAEVVLNRVDSPAYPSSVCGVVNQGGQRFKGCQFSFVCDGKAERITDRASWATAGKIAALMLEGAPRILTQGATHFHTRAVRPAWAHRFPRTATIGAHFFYRQPTPVRN